MKKRKYIAVIDLEVNAANDKKAFIEANKKASSINAKLTSLIETPPGTRMAYHVDLEKMKKVYHE
jgi:hypothetical protein